MFHLLKKILSEQKLYMSKWSKRRSDISYPSSLIISEDIPIFTIGSCFASNLAAYMGEFKLRASTHPGRPFYHTKIILQELEKLVNRCEKQQKIAAWKTLKGFQSPYMYRSSGDHFKSLQSLHNWSNKINNEASSRLHGAKVVVITLGLVEAWYHKPSDTYFKCCPPPISFRLLKPEFRRLTVKEMCQDLINIRKIVLEQLNAKLIITVSPVPLHTTFMPFDIQVANSESKSRIRAAVSEFIDKFPDVFYFPSYEIVSCGEGISEFMKKDGRHLHPDAIRYVLRHFVNRFARRDLVVNDAKERWLKPVEKLYESPDLKGDYPAEKAKRVAEAFIKNQKRVYIYGVDEWSMDFLYESGILSANLVGFIVDDIRKPFCGQNCFPLSHIKKQTSSFVIIAKNKVSGEVVQKLREVFTSENIISIER